jgi:hypothetical protein
LREEREKPLDSDGKEKKISLALISATKTVDIYVKWFYFIRGVQLRCFFFILKVPKKINLSLKKILVLGRFWVLVCFFGFFRPLIGLSRFIRCFLGVLGKKWVLR